MLFFFCSNETWFDNWITYFECSSNAIDKREIGAYGKWLEEKKEEEEMASFARRLN